MPEPGKQFIDLIPVRQRGFDGVKFSKQRHDLVQKDVLSGVTYIIGSQEPLQDPFVLFRNIRIIHELFFGSLSPLFIVSYRHGTITSRLVLNVVLEEWECGCFILLVLRPNRGPLRGSNASRLFKGTFLKAWGYINLSVF
jgi:hypothetical protein